MKKVLKFLGIFLVVIIALVAIVPFAFSDKIEAFVKEEINNYVDANVNYDDFSLSIFSSFPDLRAGLDGVSVIGRGRFEGDTLAYVGALSADLKIMPLLDGEIKINSILVDNPVVRGIVAADSLANWDIYKSEPDTVVAVEDTTSSALNLALDKVRISNADIAYLDSTMNLFAHIRDLNLEMTGDMVGDIFNATLALDVKAIDVEMDKLNYLKGATVDFDAEIEADLANNKYSFKENTLNFSGVPLAFDGYVLLKDSVTTTVDLKLAAKETSFKTLLALIPDYIMKDVAGLRMDGSLELYADVEGDYIDMDHIPAIDAAFKVNNGVIKYPDLPKALNDINIDLAIKNPSGSADLTTVDVNKFHFELGSNPFDAYLNLVKPISNPTFSTGINGSIDLNSLKDALPLDSMSISGLVKANIKVATDMAAIEKEDYENIKAEGTVNLTNFVFESSDFPQGVNISEAALLFTPKFLQLDPLKATLGESDFNATGKVESYLPYVLSDGTIKGSLTLQSNLINCNELLGEDTASSEAAPDSTATVASTAEPSESSVVEVPKNIDFVLNTDIKKILYDKLTINNVKGGVVVRSGVAKLNNINLNMCDGTIGLNGTYSTQNINKPFFDMAIAMTDVEINSLTNSFSTVDSLIPVAKSAHGKVSISMDLVSDIDNEMSPVLKTMNGKGSFKSESLSLKDADFQKKISKALGNDKYNEMTMKTFKGSFTIENGNIVLSPFNVNLFNKVATFSGKQGLDQTMDYLMTVPVSRAEIASLINKTGINLSTEGADLPLGINIGGVLTDPSVSINLDELKKSVGNEVKEKVKEEVKEKVTEKVNETVETLKEEGVEKAVENLKNDKDVKKATDQVKSLFKKKK